MNKKRINSAFVLCLLVNLNLFAEILSDNRIGYTVSLPSGWTRQIIDSTYHIFEDTTDKHKSIVGVKVYNLQEDFQNPFTEKEWTELNFWMYYMLVSVESTNVVIYIDTLIATEKNNRYISDIYTFFYDPEGSNGDIAEYIRYTAAGNKGFEIYAIGPLDDIDTNLKDYVELIDSLTVTSLKSKVEFVPFSKTSQKKFLSSGFLEVDLLGRNFRNKKIASQISVSKAVLKRVRLR